MSDHETRYDNEVVFFTNSTPKAVTKHEPSSLLKPHWMLYTSWLVALLQPFHYGWSTSQHNYSGWNDVTACNARPVADGTCMMFPGHTKTQWTFAVNMWAVGGAIGSLSSALLADKLGRRKAMMINCIFMVTGAVVQLSVSDIWAFVVGRIIAGVASGLATGLVGTYINEISPPHLKNTLGVGFQISITIGIVLVGCTTFFANTSSGWRYVAGFPIVVAALFLILGSKFMAESPPWLLSQGRRSEAEAVLARLFGQKNVHIALKWIEVESNGEDESSGPQFMKKSVTISDLSRLALRLLLVLASPLHSRSRESTQCSFTRPVSSLRPAFRTTASVQ